MLNLYSSSWTSNFLKFFKHCKLKKKFTPKKITSRTFIISLYSKSDNTQSSHATDMRILTITFSVHITQKSAKGPTPKPKLAFTWQGRKRHFSWRSHFKSLPSFPLVKKLATKKSALLKLPVFLVPKTASRPRHSH